MVGGSFHTYTCFFVKSKTCCVPPSLPVHSNLMPKMSVTLTTLFGWVSHFRQTHLNHSDNSRFLPFRCLYIVIPGWILWNQQIDNENLEQSSEVLQPPLVRRKEKMRKGCMWKRNTQRICKRVLRTLCLEDCSDFKISPKNSLMEEVEPNCLPHKQLESMIHF